MHSQTAENVNSPSAFFDGIAGSLAAIIGFMTAAFAFGRSLGMSLRVSAHLVSSSPVITPPSAKLWSMEADFIAPSLCFYRSKNILFSTRIGVENFGISLK